MLLLFQSPALAGVPALDTKALHVTAIVERLPDRDGLVLAATHTEVFQLGEAWDREPR